jgi:hypothetical protein
VAGVALAELAVQSGNVAHYDFKMWGQLFALTLFFSLFPDLDTSSIPQRWFFRAILSSMIALAWFDRYRLAALVGVVALLPVVDHHRGWTHWRLAPLIIPTLLFLLFGFWNAAVGDGSLPAGIQFASSNKMYLFACVTGWHVHLVLDGYFKLFPTDRDHH